MLRRLEKLFEVPGSGNRISAMEGMRGYAALIVFLLHFSLAAAPALSIDLQKPQGMGWILEWLYYSNHGVDVFFLLSGYLIVGLARKPNFTYSSYVVHRVVRIYPALLAMLVVCTASTFLVSGELVPLGRFIGNVLLLNGAFGTHHVQAINYVTWSIFFEFCFYLSFPLLFRMIGLWGAVAISLLVIGLLTIDADGRYIRFVMFYAGVLLKLYPPVWLRRVPDWTVMVAFLTVTTGSMFLPKVWMFILPLAPVAALLADRALHTHGLVHRVFSFRPLRLFGNVSYSFYLFHPVGLTLGRLAATSLHLTRLPWVIVTGLASFAFSTVLALGAFWCFERPYFLWRGRRAVSSSPMPAVGMHSPVVVDRDAI